MGLPFTVRRMNIRNRTQLPPSCSHELPDPVSRRRPSFLAPTQLRGNLKNGIVQIFYMESKSGFLRGSDGTRAIGAQHIDIYGDWTIQDGIGQKPSQTPRFIQHELLSWLWTFRIRHSRPWGHCDLICIHVLAKYCRWLSRSGSSRACARQSKIVSYAVARHDNSNVPWLGILQTMAHVFLLIVTRHRVWSKTIWVLVAR